MAEQQILGSENNYEQLNFYLKSRRHKKILLVCGDSIKYFAINRYFNLLENNLEIKVIRFSCFTSNPTYESVVEGVRVLKTEGCTLIIAVGGGSAIDVAKCIKLYSNMDDSRNYLKQNIIPNDIELIALPTTAGTGSEATRFAVIYYNGEKQSVSDYSCIPSVVLLDASVLETLPEYQRKATMMDALCHATESFWSINSTKESRQLAKEAIELIISNFEGYLMNTSKGNAGMLTAANLAGKAINITQTTAGHAMCYKISTLYGIAHGHAAALCVSVLFPYMLKNLSKCIDSRGEIYLRQVFKELAKAYGCDVPEKAAQKFSEILCNLNLQKLSAKEEDYEILRSSVNPIRMRNNPIELGADIIDYLYHRIFAN